MASPRLRAFRERRLYRLLVVVSAIGRKGEPYATDTLLSLLTDVDPLVDYDLREMDLMLCCGEIMSTCIFAQTLKSLGQPASAMTGGQAGLITDDAHGNARIMEVRPHDVVQIQYTSGTTGFPKDALLHHHGIVNNTRLTTNR